MKITIMINVSEELALLCMLCGQTPETLIKIYVTLISSDALDNAKGNLELATQGASNYSINCKEHTLAYLSTFLCVTSSGYKEDITKVGLPPFGDSLE